MYWHKDVDLYYIVCKISHRYTAAEPQQLDGSQIMAQF